MDDAKVLSSINELVDEEHGLYERSAKHGGLSAEEEVRLRQIETSLDQCWDLLRQRRARRGFGDDPDQASVRATETVEGYRQ